MDNHKGYYWLYALITYIIAWLVPMGSMFFLIASVILSQKGIEEGENLYFLKYLSLGTMLIHVFFVFLLKIL